MIAFADNEPDFTIEAFFHQLFNAISTMESETKVEEKVDDDKKPGTSEQKKVKNTPKLAESASPDKKHKLKTKTSNYTDTVSLCCACHQKTPHSQLFVCMKEGCGYALKQTMPIMSPALFYRRETVFCGACAFRGLHAPHRAFLRAAEPLAFYTASQEVGTRLEMEFEKFQKLSDTHPVDYHIMKATGSSELPKIPFAKYLETSKSIIEWHRRQSRIYNVLRLIKEQREEGHRLVKNEAEKLLTAYSKVSTELERETTVTITEKAEEARVRLAEHRLKMGIKPVEEEKSFSSVSSRSGRSSNATNQTVRQMPSKSDMQKALNDVDDEITGGRIYTSIKVESFDEPKKEIVEENANFIDESVPQTIIVMGRRFEMIRRYSSIKDTIEQLADILDSRIKCVRHRQKVVDHMEKNYNIKWSRQLK
ncbi:hypothetical protein GCK72_003599 [Caenorhabditis remanei]|uniref:Uncharacterized protein n=1 Tax=Caenorhabditis remanei TaxID=31234 RepID=A0A6A5HWR6_CAERE|nr:hypothetical protein GCK72_003599 [Caenorhabditis remanei]KAF1771771.1 hypothetical protein GCK72_003599 [Caenorhabditis remanei]